MTLIEMLREKLKPIRNLSYDEINGRDMYRGVHFYTKDAYQKREEMLMKVIERLERDVKVCADPLEYKLRMDEIIDLINSEETNGAE